MPDSVPISDRQRPGRIFIRAPNWLGDLVMATASFARIRRGFPEAHITCGMRPYLRPLVSGSDHFDEIVDAPRAGGLRGLWRQITEMRKRRYDLAIVLPNSLETGLVPFLAGVPRRLGYRQGRPGLMTAGLRARAVRGFLSRHGPRRVPEPMPIYYARLMDLLGLPPGGVRGELQVSDAERRAVDERLRALGIAGAAPPILITVGASYGDSKMWVPERFAAVARHFIGHRGIPCVLLAGPREVELADRIAADCGAISINPALPLDQLKALVERCGLMITGDTGPRHLAVAFDRPVVCLIGPSDPRYSSYCTERTRLLRKSLPCSPCQRKTCPLGHHDCMRTITVGEVVQAAEELLGPG